MSVVRWTFFDPDGEEAVILPINPNTMAAPQTPREMRFAFGSRWGQDRIRGIDSRPSTPPQWTFGGVILSQAHYELLLEWTQRLVPIHITDHLGRTFEVVLQQFDPVERLPTARHPWRADYTMTCLLLGEVA